MIERFLESVCIGSQQMITTIGKRTQRQSFSFN